MKHVQLGGRVHLSLIALLVLSTILTTVGASELHHAQPTVLPKSTATQRYIAGGSRTIFALPKAATALSQLRVQGLPPHAQSQFTPQGLEVWTTPATPAGTYPLIIAQMGHPTAHRTLTTTTVPVSMAYGLWTPTVWDTCSKTIHDSYSVIGPDGKLYPTWHPSVDTATGCTFGHEHGRDPRASTLYDFAGGVPFGVANEALDLYNPDGMRHEDHVGHKVEWENYVKLYRTVNGRPSYSGVKCSFITHIHQGTHSPDAFTNNLHELSYFSSCTDGAKLGITVLAAIGTPGEFLQGSASGIVPIQAGSPVPADSPVGLIARRIPESQGVKDYFWVPQGTLTNYYLPLNEIWSTETFITRPGGWQLAFFDPYFAIRDPIRYYDPAQPTKLSRFQDACYKSESNGDKVQSGPCLSTTNNLQTQITWDDPKAYFKGVQHSTFFNRTIVSNKGNPSTWYTDPYGGNAQTTPFTGSIKQFISATDNTNSTPTNSVIFTRSYDAKGVHAPN